MCKARVLDESGTTGSSHLSSICLSSTCGAGTLTLQIVKRTQRGEVTLFLHPITHPSTPMHWAEALRQVRRSQG